MDTRARLKVNIQYGLEKCDLDVTDFATIIGCRCTKTARKYLKDPTGLSVKQLQDLERIFKTDLIQVI